MSDQPAAQAASPRLDDLLGVGLTGWDRLRAWGEAVTRDDVAGPGPIAGDGKASGIADR